MLTLIKGKARKSVYMTKLFDSSKNSVFVQYGCSSVLNLPNGKESWKIERGELSKTNLNELKTELWRLVEYVLTKTNHNHLFLYGNFNLREVEILKEVLGMADCAFYITASIQDDTIPSGQIVIEEMN